MVDALERECPPAKHMVKVYSAEGTGPPLGRYELANYGETSAVVYRGRRVEVAENGGHRRGSFRLKNQDDAQHLKNPSQN